VSDRAVTANRRLLLRAIEAFAAGQPTPALARDEEVARSLTGPLTVDTIAPSVSWEQHWRQHEAERRAASPWGEPRGERRS
jgi:phthalate 4,5-dioxygenase oxygenase subunit